jgi:hypothetical protein
LSGFDKLGRLHQLLDDIIIAAIAVWDQAVGAALETLLCILEAASAIKKIEGTITKQTVELVRLMTRIEFTSPIGEIFVMFHDLPSLFRLSGRTGILNSSIRLNPPVMKRWTVRRPLLYPANGTGTG